MFYKILEEIKMDPNQLETGKVYKTTTNVKACMYDKLDCLMTNMIDLPAGTDLTYIEPDADDGYVFTNAEGTKFCLHDNDLYALN
jgi:hypothetical protein